MPRLELASLLVELWLVAVDPVADLRIELTRNPGQDVDEAVRVGRHEVDGRVAHAELVHRGGDRQPPPAGVAGIAEMAAADHAQDDPAFLALDRRQGRGEALTPGLVEPAPVVLGGAGGLSLRLVFELDVLQR